MQPQDVWITPPTGIEDNVIIKFTTKVANMSLFMPADLTSFYLSKKTSSGVNCYCYLFVMLQVSLKLFQVMNWSDNNQAPFQWTICILYDLEKAKLGCVIQSRSDQLWLWYNCGRQMNKQSTKTKHIPNHIIMGINDNYWIKSLGDKKTPQKSHTQNWFNTQWWCGETSPHYSNSAAGVSS